MPGLPLAYMCIDLCVYVAVVTLHVPYMLHISAKAYEPAHAKRA